MGKPTTEAVMGNLHIAVSTRLVAEVIDIESDPRFVGMAIKFLNDNKVMMLPEVSAELGELDRALNRRKQRFTPSGITDIATKQAQAMNE